MKVKTIQFTSSGSKPSRTLTQWNMGEIAAAMGAEPKFPYFVRMLPGESPAGNHFHHKKREFFVCVEGELLIVLEDPETNERAEIVLHADETQPAPASQGIVVPLGIAHAVKNIGTTTAGLLVFSSHLAREADDDIEYKVL